MGKKPWRPIPAAARRTSSKQQCAQCHRFGDLGEGLGPDLGTVSRRFQKKEILESVLHPSQVISDQYASKAIELKDGRTLNGLVSPQTDGGVLVLTSDGQKAAFPQDAIEAIRPSKVSVMPTGLLNKLSLEGIAELFAYLGQPPRQNLSSRRAGRAAVDGSTETRARSALTKCRQRLRIRPVRQDVERTAFARRSQG
ncbi:MAG: hypothetical protein QM811_18295 [Pirellulales bacterium]